MSPRTYWVYILASAKNGTLYVGVTNSLQRRMWEHKNRTADSFTSRYGIDHLVYYSEFRDVRNAISREKQIKAGLRATKIALIEMENPEWHDLAEQLFGISDPPDAVAGKSKATKPSR